MLRTSISRTPGGVGKPNRLRTKGGVTIGNDVWIADNVIVLGGVTIGDGCCIGAGSVVTHSFAPYTVAVGNPCKAIRRRFKEDVALLLALRWWDWSEERIRRNERFFMADLDALNAQEIAALIRE